MRIATWNVNSLNKRMPRVEEWLGYAKPDVLCLQETKLSDANFPSMAFAALGYESAHCGQGQWNGVAILSRVGLDDVVAGFPDQADDEVTEARLLWAMCGGVRVLSVYVPNGRQVDTEHYFAKLEWLERLRSGLDKASDPTEPFVMCELPRDRAFRRADDLSDFTRAHPGQSAEVNQHGSRNPRLDNVVRRRLGRYV